MPKIYLVTPNDSNDIENKKTKYVIIKNGKVKNLNNKEFNKDIDNFSSNNLIFQIIESHVKDLKKHIEKNIENFNENFPEKFLELLKEDSYIKEKYDIQEKEENLIQSTHQFDEEEEKLLGAISKSTSTTPILSRPNSVRFEDLSKVETPNLSEKRKATSLHDLSGKDSPETSSLVSTATASSRNSISSLDSLEQERKHKQLTEISSFFTKKSNDVFENIKNHGEKIKKSFSNGQEKSIHLLLISEVAKKIGQDSHDLLINASSTVDLETLKRNINELNDYIKNKQTTDILSHYRGFSPLRCFATLWGGGKVTSIKYVKELQQQLDTLTKNISDIRLTA